MLLTTLICFVIVDVVWGGVGMLYPKDSESRDSKLLDGIWRFRADFSPTRNQGFQELWWKRPLSETGAVIDMPVPSSYNDVTEDKSLRDFVGWVWYDKNFFVPSSWASDKRVILRFDSAHYFAYVEKTTFHSNFISKLVKKPPEEDKVKEWKKINTE